MSVPKKETVLDHARRDARNTGEDDTSEYELLRLRNIERNKALMKNLGLGEKMIKQRANRVPKRRPKDEDSEPVEPRRSKRVAGGPVDYTKEHVNTLGEETYSKKEVSDLRNAESKPQREREEELAELAKAEEEARLEMYESQAAEEPIVLDKKIESTWKQKAELRWGQRINLAKPRSWETYVKSRMPITVPRSPSGLLQESYADCPWRLLITCCLMSRVSSAETKIRCIEGFFSAFPTPSACLDNAEVWNLLPIIDSLGLFPTRYKSVMDITRRFLSDPKFDCQRDGDFKIYGVGDFGVSSFEIWCRGLGHALHPKDNALSAFCSWLRQNKDSKISKHSIAMADSDV